MSNPPPPYVDKHVHFLDPPPRTGYVVCVWHPGIGLSQPTTMLQLSEISLIRFRGTLGIMGALFSNGSFIFSLVGTYHTYKINWKLCIISIIMRKTRSYLDLGGYMFTFLVHFGFNGTYHFISDIIILSTRISTLAYEKRENIWGRRCNVEIKGP